MLTSKKVELKYLLTIVLLLVQLGNAIAQNAYGSEKELKKKADGFFDKEDYITCISMYSQLLSIYPKDPEYNFRYGVCNLFAGSEKDKSIAYLSLAAKSEEVDKEVFYYLGKALHLNYRFDEAIANYNIFKTKASAKSLTKLDVNRQIEMCNNGKELLRNITDLQVIDKNEFPIVDYFRAYDLTSIDTRILVKPEDMQTPIDKKKNDQSVIVQKNGAQEIYFSSYGEDAKGSRDIYKIVKLPNYTFSKPIKLGNEINTAYDEEYPYVTPDGKTLYFCSKGHNSMGGYDIFKSEYNAETGKYSTPVNLDFAINTPDDDILYIYDGKGEFAYFSSKRNSGADKISVYKIKHQRIPGTVAMVKGNFFTTDEKTHQAAKITLKNQAGTKVIGAYNVNPKTGDYQFMIRQGETYLYTVESKDFETMSREVKIPVLTELTPIKQKIQLKHDGNADLLTISTEIEAGTTPELLQATMALLRERANLSVSSGPTLETNPETKNEPKAIVDDVNKTAANNTATEVKKDVATNATNPENKNSTTTNNTNLDNKAATNTTTNNAANTQTNPTVTTNTTGGESTPKNATENTTQNNVVNTENKPTVVASNTVNKPTNTTEVKKVPNAATPIAKVDKQSVLANAFAESKKSEQEAIDFDLKSEEEKKKIVEKNDSVKLVDFRTEELTTMTTKLTNPMQLEIARERIDELREEATTLKKQAADAAVKSEEYKQQAAQERTNAIKEKEFADKLATAINTKNDAEFERLYYSKFPKEQAVNNEPVSTEIPDAGKSNEQLKSEISSLESKKNTLKSDLTKTNSADVKSVINNQISSINKEQNEKESILAARDAASASTGENLPAAKSNTTIDANNYPSEAKQIVGRSNGLLSESAQLKKEAEVTRKNAATIGDANTKNAELIRASNLDKESRQKEVEAYTNLMQANAILKKSQEQLVIDNSNAAITKKSEPSYTTASNLNKQANEGFKAAEIGKASAAKEPNLKAKADRLKDAFETERLALQQQKKAAETYAQLNTDVASKPTDNAVNNSAVATNVPTEKKVEKAEVKKEFEKSEQFPKYTALYEEKKAVDQIIEPKKIEIDTLKKNSTKELATASDLRSYAETLKSKSKKESALNAAVVYENSSAKINTQVVEKQKVVDSLQTISDAKKNEAEKIYSNFESKVSPTNTVSENSNVKPIKELDYTQSELDNIVKKQDYLSYYQTKYTGDSLEFEYQKTFKKVQSLKEEADALLAEKENLDIQAKSEKNGNLKLELKNKAKEKYNQSLARIASADSLYEIAQTFAKKIELADNKLQLVVNRLDNKSADEYPIIYNGLPKKPFEMTTTEYNNSKNVVAQNAKTATNEINAKTASNDINSKTATSQEPNNPTNANNTASNTTSQVVVPNPEATTNAKSAAVIDTVNKNVKATALQPAQSNVTTPKSNVKPIEGLDYTQDDLDNIRRSTNYIRYYRDKYTGDSLEFVYQKVFKQVEVLKTEAEKLYEEKEALIEEAKEEKDSKKKQEMRLLAKQKGEQANAKIEEADVLYTNAQELAKKIEESDKKLQVVVNSLDDKSADEFPLIYNSLAQKPFDKTEEEYKQMLASNTVVSNTATSNSTNTNDTNQQSTNTNNNPKTAVASNTDSKSTQKVETPKTETTKETKNITVNKNTINKELASNTKQAEKQISAESSAFEIQQGNAYSNDIPLDVELPKGIIFKVQIGAYKRKVSASAFGGIKPISGETSRTGMIRYSAGIFKNYNASNDARKQINNAGFNDAYIIAFCNGVRIDVNRARKMLEDGVDCDGNQTNESIAQNAANTNLSEEMIQILATQKNLKKTEGLLYTVQVGVYKRLISTKRLYNLNDLYYDTLRRGLIRYSHGVFNTKKAATEAKNRVVEIGIKDAFVIPYFNKRYIPDAEAERLKSSNRNILIKDELVTKSTTTTNVTNNSNTGSTATTGNSKADISELKFKVQLGVYRKTVPVEVMSVYLKLAGKGIDELQGNDGTTTYSIGNFSSLEEANTVKAEAQALGLNDVFVAPYNKGIKISMEQALKLLGK